MDSLPILATSARYLHTGKLVFPCRFSSTNRPGPQRLTRHKACSIWHLEKDLEAKLDLTRAGNSPGNYARAAHHASAATKHDGGWYSEIGAI